MSMYTREQLDQIDEIAREAGLCEMHDRPTRDIAVCEQMRPHWG